MEFCAPKRSDYEIFVKQKFIETRKGFPPSSDVNLAKDRILLIFKFHSWRIIFLMSPNLPYQECDNHRD
jgi:hypothetical protein